MTPAVSSRPARIECRTGDPAWSIRGIRLGPPGLTSATVPPPDHSHVARYPVVPATPAVQFTQHERVTTAMERKWVGTPFRISADTYLQANIIPVCRANPDVRGLRHGGAGVPWQMGCAIDVP